MPGQRESGKNLFLLFENHPSLPPSLPLRLRTYLGGLEGVVGREVDVEEEDGAAVRRVICMGVEKKEGRVERGGDTSDKPRRKKKKQKETTQ